MLRIFSLARFRSESAHDSARNAWHPLERSAQAEVCAAKKQKRQQHRWRYRDGT
jgi:hypothetical protein